MREGGREETRRVKKKERERNVPLEPQSDPVDDPDDSGDEDSSGSSEPTSQRAGRTKVSFGEEAMEEGRKGERSSPESGSEEAQGRSVVHGVGLDVERETGDCVSMKEKTSGQIERS